jgi:hypothetical protein
MRAWRIRRIFFVRWRWVRLTSAGLRVSFHATGADPWAVPPPVHVPIRQAMSKISVTDDSGHVYNPTLEGVSWSRGRDRREQEWHGQMLLDPGPAGKPAWLEFSRARAGTSSRVFPGDRGRPDRSGNPVRSDVKDFLSERTEPRASGLVRCQSDRSYPG